MQKHKPQHQYGAERRLIRFSDIEKRNQNPDIRRDLDALRLQIEQAEQEKKKPFDAKLQFLRNHHTLSLNKYPMLRGPQASTVEIEGLHRKVEGSGIILTYDGFLITNEHVANKAKNGYMQVVLENRTRLWAKVLFMDPEKDYAIAKVTPTEALTPAIFGPRKNVHVGDRAAIIGNAHSYGEKIVPGIVGDMKLTSLNGRWAALQAIRGRMVEGNSGGGVFHLQTGELLGMNTARSRKEKDLGYFIPAYKLAQYFNKWVQENNIQAPQLTDPAIAQERIGADMHIVSLRMYNTPTKMFISSVTKGSPADAAGWKAGDILLSLGAPGNERTMVNMQSVLWILKQPFDTQSNAGIRYRLLRDGKQVSGTIAVIPNTQ